jgi:hypothetical protein
MEAFLTIFIGVAVVLLLVVIFGGKKHNWRKLLYFFIEEVDEDEVQSRHSARSSRNSARRKTESRHGSSRRNSNQAYTEMAILLQKIDERRRVVDSSGHSTLYDEYFELVFQTRKGEELHLTASRAAFKEIPFNQQGSLTHKKGTLIKFKYAGGLISDEYSPMQR